MPSSSPIERAKPLLGTMVEVRVAGLGTAAAHAAIDAAFADIAAVHTLMSFHEAASDLSRINRLGCGMALEIDPRTAVVHAFALDLAAKSDGAFDPAAGALAVAAGDMPRPEG